MLTSYCERNYNNVFINIRTAPTNNPIKIYLLHLYFKAFGINSCIASVIIIPATNINTILISLYVIYLCKKINAIKAPNGSARPDRSVFFIASILLLVE